ncbi:hypothetical protein A4G19_10665 [Pasteurellaceae bacterium Macca]|nr:hypothetical protein [Pasteurellaceae bacterium Macca]
MHKGEVQNLPENRPLAIPELTFTVEMSEDNRNVLLSNWFALHNTLELLAELEPPLRALNSPFASKVYTHVTSIATI